MMWSVCIRLFSGDLSGHWLLQAKAYSPTLPAGQQRCMSHIAAAVERVRSRGGLQHRELARLLPCPQLAQGRNCEHCHVAIIGELRVQHQARPEGVSCASCASAKVLQGFARNSSEASMSNLHSQPLPQQRCTSSYLLVVHEACQTAVNAIRVVQHPPRTATPLNCVRWSLLYEAARTQLDTAAQHLSLSPQRGCCPAGSPHEARSTSCPDPSLAPTQEPQRAVEMGNAFRKLFDRMWGTRDMRVGHSASLSRLWPALPYARRSCALLLHSERPAKLQVVMLGLDAAGKTTILYKLHIGEVLSTVPTIGALPLPSNAPGHARRPRFRHTSRCTLAWETCPVYIARLWRPGNVVSSDYITFHRVICRLQRGEGAI